MTATALPPAAPLAGARSAATRRRRAVGLGRFLLSRLLQLITLLLVVSTVLFFLLQISGDPAVTLAGQNATPESVAAIRAQYGLDRPVVLQYLSYLANVARLDFGTSLLSGQSAIAAVLTALPSTAKLAGLAIVFELIVAVPIAAWLGSRPDGYAQRAAAGVTFVAQGVPGYVIGLVLIQIFAVRLQLLPSIGNAQPLSWVLPAMTLSAFLVPRLTRVLASNVSKAMREEYIQTAIANGAGRAVVVLRHALPNALLGATALVGGQIAILLSGSLVTETIFAWPGLGLLIVHSVQDLDFPIVQASVFVVAAMVFLANNLVDLLFRVIDPRLRGQRA